MAPHLTRNESQSSCNGTHKTVPTPSVASVASLTSFPFPVFLLAHATSSSDLPAISPKWQANFRITDLYTWPFYQLQGYSLTSRLFLKCHPLKKTTFIQKHTSEKRVSILDCDKKTHSGISLTDILGTKLKVINFQYATN